MSELVAVGRIVKAHGIRGEVVVELLSDLPGRLEAGTAVRVAGAPRTIASSRPHQGRLLVRFEGVADRSEAEGLRGRTVEAEPVDVSEEETYYAHELVDMVVVDARGRTLGRVRSMIELPDAAGYDLLEVEYGDGDVWLLPAVDDYVEVEPDPDGGERLVLVEPPAGLVPDELPQEPDEEGPA